MNTQSQQISMENLFQLVGIDYNKLPENTSIDIYNDNINIKSFNHEKNAMEFKRITKLVRKENSEMYKVKAGNYEFKATPEHKVFTKENGYIELKDIKQNCSILLDNYEFCNLELEKLEGVYPVLDMTVEDNENYFSNSILSHNSPEKIGVGEAMKFYASIRIKTSKTEVQKDDGEEGQSSVDIVMTIIKNKVGVPFRKAQFTLLTGMDGNYGIDTEKEIIDFGIKYEFVKKSGSWYSYGEEKLGQGMPNVKKYFKDNPEKFIELKTNIVLKLNEEREKEIGMDDSFNNKLSEIVEETKTKRRGKNTKEVEEVVFKIQENITEVEVTSISENIE